MMTLVSTNVNNEIFAENMINLLLLMMMPLLELHPELSAHTLVNHLTSAPLVADLAQVHPHSQCPVSLLLLSKRNAVQEAACCGAEDPCTH